MLPEWAAAGAFKWGLFEGCMQVCWPSVLENVSTLLCKLSVIWLCSVVLWPLFVPHRCCLILFAHGAKSVWLILLWMAPIVENFAMFTQGTSSCTLFRALHVFVSLFRSSDEPSLQRGAVWHCAPLASCANDAAINGAQALGAAAGPSF